MPLVSVLSYNIHECVGTDKRRDPSRIAEVIKQTGAQIIGLQEVHSEANGLGPLHQMNYLAAATAFETVAGPALERRAGHYGNVLLTNYQILTVEKFDLSYPGREPRGAIDVDLDIGGQPVRVIVTHLGLFGAERRFQVEKLLGALSRQRTRTVILLSDFNEWLPTGRSLRWIHTRLGKTALVRTFPSTFPIFALDRIWVSPASALVDLRSIHTPLSRIASDHLPLHATIELADPLLESQGIKHEGTLNNRPGRAARFD